MATLEKRGEFWRVKVRRTGFPTQSRTFDNKALAQRWAREIENEMDRGDFVDRTEAEKNSLAEVLKRYQREVSPTKKGADSEDYRIDSILKSRVCQTKHFVERSAIGAQEDHEACRQESRNAGVKSNETKVNYRYLTRIRALASANRLLFKRRLVRITT